MGIVGVAIMFAPAVGSTLSGLLIASFFILKNVSEPRPEKLAVLGVIASTFGFGIAGKAGWGSVTVLTALSVGIVLLILFVIHQLKTDHPLIDLRIFKSTYSIIISFFVNGVSYSGMILIPIYLQTNRGFTALKSGLFLLPGSIEMAIMSPIAGKLYDRHGIKWLGIIGTLILLGTTSLYTNLTYASGIILLSLIYLVRSIGLNFLTMPLSTAGLNALPSKHYGHGTAMQNTVLAISGAMGTAIMMMQTNLFVTDEVVNTAKGNPTPEQLGVFKLDGLLHGINSAFMGATVVGVIAMILLANAINKRKEAVAMAKL